jgi:predicted HTH domain antitoxin
VITLEVDELVTNPQRVLEHAQRGQFSLVAHKGEPALLVVPLGDCALGPDLGCALAAVLYDGPHISLGLAARIAGKCQGEMIDELGRRGMATIRLQPGDLDRELANWTNDQ